MLLEAVYYYVNDRKFIYQFITTLSTYLCIRVAEFYRRRYKRFQLFAKFGIPSPKASLIGGNLWDLVDDEKQIFLKHDKLREKYGKFYGFYIGDDPIIVTTDLDQLKKIFLGNSKVFNRRSNVFLDSAVSRGILFAHYPRWKIMRKVMAPPFNSYSVRGSKSTQFIEDSIHLMTEYIDNKLDEAEMNGEKANIDMHSLMKSTALNLISGLALKLSDIKVAEKEENVDSLDEFLSTSDKGNVLYAIMFPFILPVLQFLYDNFEYSVAMGKINRKMNKLIDEQLTRLKLNKGLDTHGADQQLVDILTKNLYENKLTRMEVMGCIEALLLAGYDTTSTTMTYIFWVLGKDQKLQEELRQDLLINGCESKFLERVIKETMRIYPTVMSFTERTTDETVKIDDELTIPGGTKVSYHAWLLHRDPTIWPDPLKFDPDRFRDGVEHHPCAYAPFGLGDRRCLGYQLAMLELKMLTCDILIRYRISLISPQNLELVSFAISLSKPKEKVVLELERL